MVEISTQQRTLNPKWKKRRNLMTRSRWHSITYKSRKDKETKHLVSRRNSWKHWSKWRMRMFHLKLLRNTPRLKSWGRLWQMCDIMLRRWGKLEGHPIGTTKCRPSFIRKEEDTRPTSTILCTRLHQTNLKQPFLWWVRALRKRKRMPNWGQISNEMSWPPRINKEFNLRCHVTHQQSQIRKST